MEAKKKRVYFLQEEPQVHKAVQTEFPILKMVNPGKPKEERFTKEFKELIYWNWFEN